MKYFYSIKTQLTNMCILLLSGAFLSGCVDLAAQDSAKQLRTASYAKGDVYTMRGGLGGVFSKGMNTLQSTLERDHEIRTASTVWYKANELSDFIIHQYQTGKRRGPIVLIGHSLGANEQINVAQRLYGAHIPVELLVTVETVLPIKIPPNVKMALNLYQPSPIFVPMFSGLKVKAMDPHQTKIENIDVSTIEGISVNHFTIDKNTEVQKIMLQHILAVMSRPHKNH